MVQPRIGTSVCGPKSTTLTDRHPRHLSAFAGISGSWFATEPFEVMRMFRKGQFRLMVDSLAGELEPWYIRRLFQVFIA